MNVKLAILLLMLFVLLLIAGCTAGPNSAADTPNQDGKIAGFWKGLWHGIISPIMFIVSLFNKNVNSTKSITAARCIILASCWVLASCLADRKPLRGIANRLATQSCFVAVIRVLSVNGNPNRINRSISFEIR